jgi:hypothetical protein
MKKLIVMMVLTLVMMASCTSTHKVGKARGIAPKHKNLKAHNCYSFSGEYSVGY